MHLASGAHLMAALALQLLSQAARNAAAFVPPFAVLGAGATWIDGAVTWIGGAGADEPAGSLVDPPALPRESQAVMSSKEMPSVRRVCMATALLAHASKDEQFKT
jgi:hypothetical protein